MKMLIEGQNIIHPQNVVLKTIVVSGGEARPVDSVVRLDGLGKQLENSNGCVILVRGWKIGIWGEI